MHFSILKSARTYNSSRARNVLKCPIVPTYQLLPVTVHFPKNETLISPLYNKYLFLRIKITVRCSYFLRNSAGGVKLKYQYSINARFIFFLLPIYLSRIYQAPTVKELKARTAFNRPRTLHFSATKSKSLNR